LCIIYFTPNTEIIKTIANRSKWSIFIVLKKISAYNIEKIIFILHARLMNVQLNINVCERPYVEKPKIARDFSTTSYYTRYLFFNNYTCGVFYTPIWFTQKTMWCCTYDCLYLFIKELKVLLDFVLNLIITII